MPNDEEISHLLAPPLTLIGLQQHVEALEAAENANFTRMDLMVRRIQELDDKLVELGEQGKTLLERAVDTTTRRRIHASTSVKGVKKLEHTLESTGYNLEGFLAAWDAQDAVVEARQPAREE